MTERVVEVVLFDAFPGGDLVEKGLLDLAERRQTAEAFLVSMASQRLRSWGLDVAEPWPEPEMGLYTLLAIDHGNDAHGQYNALVRRLSRFNRAMAAANSRASRSVVAMDRD